MLLASNLGGAGGREKRKVTVFSRATDSAGRVQPFTCTWNLRGVGYDGAGEATIDH
ncbi:hypothetical protein L210DRAFT_3574261 [Boletus edulis BED1]|nr:hypothetical protein L210DRAFT_3574261 [Boletus edulis BED1]